MMASAPLHAQIIAPPLEHRAVEFGYAHKWFDRDVEPAPETIEWDAASIYARFGAFDRFTIYAEGGLWDVSATDPSRLYSRWVIGWGLTARVYDVQRWALDAQFSYNEVYDHDESSLRSDHRTYGWNAGLLARGTFTVAGQRTDVYAGPMYVDDVAEVYPFSSDDPVRREPGQHWGVCAGAYVTLFNYISGFTYVLHVDEPQLRVGVSLRSRGEER
jgi:hypothetical protein